MDRNRKGAVVHLLNEATAEEKKKHENSKIKINGSNNIVGNGNSVVVTKRHVTVTRATPKPGDEHITEAHVARLHELRDDIIRLENLAKKKPVTHQQFWSRFNRKMKIGSMRMLEIERFEEAEKYLLTWRAGLLDTKSVGLKNPTKVSQFE